MPKDAMLVQAVQKLYEWQYMQRREDDFTHCLYSLFQKATESESKKLENSFPVEAEVYRLWLKADDPVHFFAAYGVSEQHPDGVD